MTVQSANASTVWTSDLSGGVLERFSFGAGPDGIGGVAWLPDDRLVYGSTATGQVVLLMSARGGPARTLTQQADEAVSSFSVSPDGRVAVFDAVRRRSMPHLASGAGERPASSKEMFAGPNVFEMHEIIQSAAR